MQYSQFAHTLQDWRLFSNIPEISMADGKMAGSFGFLSSLAFSFFLRPPTALYVLMCVLMCVPTMCLRSTLSLTPDHRVHHVADFLWLNLLSTISTFPTPRPDAVPPCGYPSKHLCRHLPTVPGLHGFSLCFRRIIIVIVSDIFTREHGGAFFIEPFLLIYVGGHILTRILGSCPLR